MENQNEQSNRDVFMNAWVNRYYVKDAHDERGNIDYLKAEGEKEYYIQNTGYESEYDFDDDESLGEDTVKEEDVKVPLREDTVKEEDIKKPPKEKVNRNEYMKEYYAKNKVSIIGKICKKEECEYCKRSVSHQQMMKHQKSQYCKTRRLHKLEMMNN